MTKQCGIFLGTALLLVTDVFCVWAGYGPDGRSGLGVGLMAGSPTGVSLKYWTDRQHAFQGGVGWGFDEGLTLTLDYLWHDFSAFKFQDSSNIGGGQLPFYLGFGPRVETEGRDNFGIRGVGGVEYLFPKNPFGIFAEIAPVLILVRDVEGDVDGAIGVRYYFP